MEDDSNFISLAALTANVVRWLELSEHHKSDSQRQGAHESDGKDHPERHGDDVEYPLKKRPSTEIEGV